MQNLDIYVISNMALVLVKYANSEVCVKCSDKRVQDEHSV